MHISHPSHPPLSCAHLVGEESGALSYLWHPPIPHGNRDMHVIRMYLCHHLIVHHLEKASDRTSGRTNHLTNSLCAGGSLSIVLCGSLF
jgi:hypothetical protein